MEDWICRLKEHRPYILGHEDAVKTAVTVPIAEVEGEKYIVFEKRSPALMHQPGEICFPGGTTDPDDPNSRATAIRETCEELGLNPHDIEIIGELDILAPPSGLIISPFAARIKDIDLIQINQAEVEKLLLIPIDYLLPYKPLEYEIILKPEMPEDYPFYLIPKGMNYPFRVNKIKQYFYIWENEVIWGLTALILHHFLKLVKEGYDGK